MRRFVVLGHTQLVKPPLPLNDPSGLGGRWDVLARCVTSALLVSHGARTDTEVVLYLGSGAGPRTLRIVGAEVRNLNPDERSTLALLSKALEAPVVGAHETHALPGIYSSARTLNEILATAAGRGPLVHLAESGHPAPPTRGAGEIAFVLSDHRDPTPEELSVIATHSVATWALGPRALQADQCIVVAHNALDREGWMRRAGPSPPGLRPTV